MPRTKKNIKRDRQIKIAVFIMVFLLTFIVFAYWFSVQSSRFDYATLRFQKTGLPFYAIGQFPIHEDSFTRYVNVYFREDPRKLKNLEVNSSLSLTRNIGLDYDESVLDRCQLSKTAYLTLNYFLKNYGATVSLVSLNSSEAGRLNFRKASCVNSSETVIIFKIGNEDIINRDRNCIILQSKTDCGIMNITERFMIASWAQSNGIVI